MNALGDGRRTYICDNGEKATRFSHRPEATIVVGGLEPQARQEGCATKPGRRARYIAVR